MAERGQGHSLPGQLHESKMIYNTYKKICFLIILFTFSLMYMNATVA